MMDLTINGRRHDLAAGARIPDVLAILGYESPRGLAVAVDKQVIPKNRWDETELVEGMDVEVLRAVQGG